QCRGPEARHRPGLRARPSRRHLRRLDLERSRAHRPARRLVGRQPRVGHLADAARQLPCRARLQRSGGRHLLRAAKETMTALRDGLNRETKALAFDQYGTIVDMQKGLTETVTPFLKAKGWDGRPNSFVTWWRRTHYENSMIDALCDRGHTPYRQIGHRA